MKAVLWCSVIALLTLSVNTKATDNKLKTGNEKRSIEISPNAFLGGLTPGVQLINPGAIGLVQAGSQLSSNLISPAISYDSGNALFSGYGSLGYSGSFGSHEGSLGHVGEQLGGISGSFGGVGGSVGGFGESVSTVSPLAVGESFGNVGTTFGSPGVDVGTGSLGSLEGGLVTGSDIGTSSVATGAGVVSTTVSPLPATTATSTLSRAPVVTQDTHEYRQVSQHVPVHVPQPVPYTVTRTIPVPQPYTVSVPKPYPVPVHVKVPVEVPRPYTVRVPQPVSVPVAVRVPVEIPRPYPVYKTKEIKVDVEKPVFIRVPVKIQVPVPQAYRVEIPTPVRIGVPQPVFVKDRRVVNTYSNGGTFGGVQGGLYGLENFYGQNYGHNYGLGGISGVSDFGGVTGEITGIPSAGGVFEGDFGGSVIGSGGIQGINSGVVGNLPSSTPSSDSTVNEENESIEVQGRSREGNGESTLVIGGSSGSSSTENNVLGNSTDPATVDVTSETTTVANVEITSPSLLD